MSSPGISAAALCATASIASARPRKCAAFLLALASLLLASQARAYDPLEVRFYNSSGNPDSDVQILTTGTAPQDASGFKVYISNGVATTVTNGASISLTNLTPVTDATGTYRKLYVQYTMSGSFWIGLTNQQFKTSDNKGGNPSPVGPVTNQWGAAPFVQVEYSYTGSGYDTIDVTAINELSVPTW
ncbi:MAG: hypothetical protein ACKOB0_12765, partial [Chthoniobacterales bacterium]